MKQTIVVEQLVHRYPGSAEDAVRGMDFEVGQGEVFGFLGPSGAGKSTTQKILTGLLVGHRGRVAVWGKDPSAWGQSYYERVGVSFELPNLYLKLTARENLEFFASLYTAKARDPGELLDLVGLGPHADERVGSFSKGMQMRLVFVRALAHSPDLLFLDEPTSGLDPTNAKIVRELVLAERDRGATVFLTTHDMATADALCDRVAFVVNGRIAALDSPKELKLRQSRDEVRVEFRDGEDLASASFPLTELADNAAFLALLRERRVETIHSMEATLDDVFVEVTGRRLT